jgi:hypothetical protein
VRGRSCRGGVRSGRGRVCAGRRAAGSRCLGRCYGVARQRAAGASG